MYGPFLFKIFIGLVDLWTDQRIPDPVSCQCPEPRVGLLETPHRWHATICNPKGRPGGGASRRKSCIASSSSKIWKYPYRVECIDENYTLSTHFPYTLIFPIHTKKWTFIRKPPFHICYEMGKFNLPFVCTHYFAFSNPPFHTQIWTSWLLHFLRKPPPLGGQHQNFGEIPYLYIARIELLTP